VSGFDAQHSVEPSSDPSLPYFPPRPPCPDGGTRTQDLGYFGRYQPLARLPTLPALRALGIASDRTLNHTTMSIRISDLLSKASFLKCLGAVLEGGCEELSAARLSCSVGRHACRTLPLRLWYQGHAWARHDACMACFASLALTISSCPRFSLPFPPPPCRSCRH